jgi:hypothetical protein
MSWVLFGILCFLVFGIPLIDDIHRLRVRRATRTSRSTDWVGIRR